MKRYIIFFLLFALSLTISGCSNKGKGPVVNVSSEDKEMNLIIANARQNVDKFLAELNNPDTKGSDFSVKFPFDTDPGSESTKEHIWLENIECSNGKYYGIVSNEPFYIKKMKLRDKVEFDIKMVSDWKYVEDGYLVGGESIRYFYNKMSEKEKQDFELEAGYKILNK